jgi:hypothetical protein
MAFHREPRMNKPAEERIKHRSELLAMLFAIALHE